MNWVGNQQIYQPFCFDGPGENILEKREPLLRVTYIDIDTVTGRLNENLPKVISKLVPQ